VVPVSLTLIEVAIRSSWSIESCDPVDVPNWTAENPALGQCGVTALVVQDLLGGELLVAEVRHREGSRQGWHYWNRLPGAIEVDLTREQFVAGEVVGEPVVVERPADLTGARLLTEYESLDRAVTARLRTRSWQPRSALA
jgi:hypothetical protein